MKKETGQHISLASLLTGNRDSIRKALQLALKEGISIEKEDSLCCLWNLANLSKRLQGASDKNLFFAEESLSDQASLEDLLLYSHKALPMLRNMNLNNSTDKWMLLCLESNTRTISRYDLRQSIVSQSFTDLISQFRKRYAFPPIVRNSDVFMEEIRELEEDSDEELIWDTLLLNSSKGKYQFAYGWKVKEEASEHFAEPTYTLFLLGLAQA